MTAHTSLRPKAWLWTGRVVFVGVLFAAWQIAALRVGPLAAAPPTTVVAWILRETLHGDLLWQAWATWRKASIGLSVGVSLALVLSIVLYEAGAWGRAVESAIVATAGLPKYAMVPLFVLWLGVGELPSLALVTLLAFYPVFIATAAGMAAIDRRLVAVVRLLGGSRAATAREVLPYSMLPFWLSAMQIAMPRAISGAVVAEMLVGQEGLGSRIEHARQTFDMPGVFGNLAVATLSIVGVHAVLRGVRVRIAPWTPSGPNVAP